MVLKRSSANTTCEDFFMLEGMGLSYALIVVVFILGYIAIILEHYLHVNKTAVALLIAVGCWTIYFVSDMHPLPESMAYLGGHVNHIAQIIFFLIGAMTIVELIDVHKGFQIITDCIQTSSKRKLLVLISILTFCLSAVLDNLTTTILMISLLRKLIPEKKERLLLSCIVVIAANAGGAWTPIGDVTTTMLWIDGQITSIAVMKALLIPSLVSLVVPLLFYTMRFRGRFKLIKPEEKPSGREPGSRLIFCLGVGALVFIPIFKALTGLPPFMGVLIGLAILWLATDIIHRGWEERAHLKVPHVLTRIDTSGVLFFLGILLCINALESAGILLGLASWLDTSISSQAMIATLIGLFSAIVDNVPLVAATMGMYPITQYPPDSSLWHMIAYAAGTGGSILIIGSAAGVAMMGMEKLDFLSYMKKASLPALAGYLVGMGAYLWMQ